MYPSTFAHLHTQYEPPTSGVRAAGKPRKSSRRSRARPPRARPASIPASASPTGDPIAARP